MPLAHRSCLLAVGLLLLAAVDVRAADDDLLDDLDAPAPTQPTDTKTEEIEAAPAGDPGIDAPKPKPVEAAKPEAQPATLDRIKAIPRKSMLKQQRLELSPFFSASLNDSYYQHLAAAGSLVFYPHDAFGIGVGVDWMYANIKSDSVDTVRQNLTSVPAVFEHPTIFAHVDAYWVPIYGKVSLFDTSIIHFDIYAIAGMGVAFAGERRPPLATLGIGQRFVLNDFMALRFEVRDYLFVDSQLVAESTGTRPRSDIQSYVMMLAGISIFLPPSFEYTYQ